MLIFFPHPFPMMIKWGKYGLVPHWVQTTKVLDALDFWFGDHWAWYELNRTLHWKTTNECFPFCFLGHEIYLVHYDKSSK